MRRLTWGVLAVGGVACVACIACSGETRRVPAADPAVVDPTDAAAPEVDAMPADTALLPPRPAGDLPFPFPAALPPAQAGDFVLAPSRQFVDRAFVEGIDAVSFHFYGATVVEPGEAATTVKNASGAVFVLPNALILPIRAGQTAAAGDVLLSHWTSGSGMQRCLVVGGSASEPRVLYLDLPLDEPTGWGRKQDTLRAGTFHRLADGAPGAGWSCQGRYGRLIHDTGAKVEAQLLLADHEGKLFTARRADCAPLPVLPRVEAGDRVKAAVDGQLVDAVVEKVDQAIGRAWIGPDQVVPFGDLQPSK